MTLREEQRQPVESAVVILKKYNVIYMAAEVRTGKTIMALSIAKLAGWRRVCVITKKKAIGSIELDYSNIGAIFEIFKVTNFEQVKNLQKIYDGYIIDEAHSLGAFPKPSGRTILIKALVGNKPIILMSGTPNPESLSQIFHQFWVSEHGPFKAYKNFYKWAKDFVKQYEFTDDTGEKKFKVKQKFINGTYFNDYSEGKEAEIKQAIHPYMVQFSQQDAGFTSFVEEEIIRVPIDARLYKLMKVIKRDKVYTMKTNGDDIVADTPVRMQSIFHQLSSGTITITYFADDKEKKRRHVLDKSKAYFIKTKFAGHKIAIFYLFIAEGDLLREIFPNCTDDPELFNSRHDLHFICQMRSGSMGVNLSSADAQVMYNIDFSATTYWQIRGRMQTKDRKQAVKLYWIFSDRGIEHKVYKAVSEKKDYTVQYFKRDLKNWDPEQLSLHG